jgi:hypothetical protein
MLFRFAVGTALLMFFVGSLPARSQLIGAEGEIGGTETSAGGPFTLTGTLSQPAPSEEISGGPYQLSGAFLAVERRVVTGDVNGDGLVDVRDVQTLLNIYIGLQSATPGQIEAGDTRPKPGNDGRDYGDGKIRSDDLNWLLRRILGLASNP